MLALYAVRLLGTERSRRITAAANDPDRRLYADIEELLNRMGADDREVVVLKAIDGLTFREIARITKTSINTIASRYRRGLEKLKHIVQEESL